MKKFHTGAVRDTGGKGRFDLLPWCAIRRLSEHMEKGNEGHGERNWEKGIPIHCFLDSAFRHMSKYMEGLDDEDHLCAAAWNLTCAMWMEENRPDMQDIPSRKSSYDFSLHSRVKEDRRPAEAPETQEKPKEGPSEVCSCYADMSGSPRCMGTKECDPCSCGGDKEICDFYPMKRIESLTICGEL